MLGLEWPWAIAAGEVVVVENGSWGRFYGGRKVGEQEGRGCVGEREKGGNGACQESGGGREKEIGNKFLQMEMSLGLAETETLALCSKLFLTSASGIVGSSFSIIRSARSILSRSSRRRFASFRSWWHFMQ